MRGKAKMMAWIEGKNKPTHKFLTREDKPYPTIRSIGSILLILIVGATLLWGITGQPLGAAPIVVIESESMMHCEQGLRISGGDCETSNFLGIGTIDTGDLIFVKAPGTIETMAADGKTRYGQPGDTIIYLQYGRDDLTPIIHRAMFTMEFNGDGTFNVPELGLDHITDFNHPSIRDQERFGLHGGCQLRFQTLDHAPLGPEHNGVITKGDNNDCWDQGQGTVSLPIQEDWILGKARGELPWIGVVKLFVFDILQGTDNHANNAPGNIKAAGWIVVGAIMIGPTVVDKLRTRYGSTDEPSEESE